MGMGEGNVKAEEGMKEREGREGEVREGVGRGRKGRMKMVSIPRFSGSVVLTRPLPK